MFFSWRKPLKIVLRFDSQIISIYIYRNSGSTCQEAVSTEEEDVDLLKVRVL